MTQGTVSTAVINQLANDIHCTALDKGFWEPLNEFIGEINTKLLLIVSEVAEAQEVLRNQYAGEVNPYSHMTTEQGDDFIEEIADVIIRAFDLVRYFEGVHPNIADVIVRKMAKNAARPRKHGKRF